MSLTGPSVFRDCSSRGNPSGSTPCRMKRIQVKLFDWLMFHLVFRNMAKCL